MGCVTFLAKASKDGKWALALAGDREKIIVLVKDGDTILPLEFSLGDYGSAELIRYEAEVILSTTSLPADVWKEISDRIAKHYERCRKGS